MPRTATPPKINPRANPAPRRLSVQPMSGDLVPVGDQGYDIPDEFRSYHWQQDTSCSPFKSAEEFKEVLGRSRVSTALPLLSAYEWTRPKVMLLSGVVSSASPPMVARVVFPGGAGSSSESRGRPRTESSRFNRWMANRLGKTWIGGSERSGVPSSR